MGAAAMKAATSLTGLANDIYGSVLQDDATQSALRRANRTYQTGAVDAINNVQRYGAKGSRRMDPYAGLGTAAANEFQSLLFGSPNDYFQPALVIPDRPNRKDYRNDKDYTAARKAWAAEYDSIREQAAARGIQMPARGSFTLETTSGAPTGTGLKTDNKVLDTDRMNKWIRDWNSGQQQLANEQAQMKAMGIDTPDKLQSYLSQTGQLGRGGLMSTYDLPQFNQQYGTNVNMQDLVKPYTLDDYAKEWGYDPRQALQPGQFQESPDYQWRKSQGMAGIEQGAAAKGGLLSGATLKALDDYNSNLASGEYQNWWNRDMQNRTMNLGNYYDAVNKNLLDKQTQEGLFTDAFNRNMQNKKNVAGLLGGALASGQNAAGWQAQNDVNMGNSIADLTMNNANWQAGGNLASGASRANQWRGIQGGINNFLQNISSMGTSFGNTTGGGGGGMGGGSGNGIGAVDMGNTGADWGAGFSF